MAKASGVGRKRGNFFMQGHRTEKIAPVNMNKSEHQYVIDGYLIDEVLKQIPDGIDIIQASIRATLIAPQRAQIVPNELKKLGVSRIYAGKSAIDVSFVFDEISKTNLVRHVKQACKGIGVSYNKAHFKYITLTNGEGTGIFKHVTKEVKPDETDLRKKLRVLAITTGKGKVQSLLSDLGAKKFKCTIKEEPVKFIMCSRE